MAVVKHYSIKNSPLALLKYITGETKAQKAEIVRGINCSVDPKSAYLEMSLCYETFAGEKFHRTEKPEGKEHIQKASQELELLKSQLPAFERESEKLGADKKTVTAQYTTFIRQIETDYERNLRSAKEELEEYEANLSKPKEEKVNAKEAERKRLAEEQQRAEARRKRSGDSR